MGFISSTESISSLEYKFYVTFVFEFPQEICVRVEAVTHDIGKLESEPGNIVTLYSVPE